MSKKTDETKVRLTIVPGSPAHKRLDELKIPYRNNGRSISVTMTLDKLAEFTREKMDARSE